MMKKNKLENLICNAYTVIEYDFSFEKYYSDPCNERKFETEKAAHKWWETLKKDYKFVSESLTDNTIIEMQQFIIREL